MVQRMVMVHARGCPWRRDGGRGHCLPGCRVEVATPLGARRRSGAWILRDYIDRLPWWPRRRS